MNQPGEMIQRYINYIIISLQIMQSIDCGRNMYYCSFWKTTTKLQYVTTKLRTLY